jgi:hypothetical protein
MNFSDTFRVYSVIIVAKKAEKVNNIRNKSARFLQEECEDESVYW